MYYTEFKGVLYYDLYSICIYGVPNLRYFFMRMQLFLEMHLSPQSPHLPTHSIEYAYYFFLRDSFVFLLIQHIVCLLNLPIGDLKMFCP